MKKILIISGILIFLFSTSFSQTKPTPAENTQNKEVKVDKKAPVMTFEETVYDFGTIKKGDPAQCEFFFKNTGKKPLVITRCRST